MSKLVRRDTNRNHLSDGHDNRKHNRTEFLNGVKDAQLSRSRCDGREDVVHQDFWIGLEEFEYDGEISTDEQADGGHDDGGGIDPEHHLEGVDVGSTVGDVDFILPLRREAVEGNVHEHKDEAGELCGVITLGLLAKEGEDDHSERDERGLDVLRAGVGRPLEELAHDHDGDDLGGLEHRLDGKGHVPERGVLRPAAHGVGEGAGCKGPERRDVVVEYAPVLDLDADHGDEDGEEAVGEDAKGRRGEFAVGGGVGGLELGRDDELLHVAPGEVGDHEAREGEYEFGGLDVEIGVVDVGRGDHAVAAGGERLGYVSVFGSVGVAVAGLRREGLIVHERAGFLAASFWQLVGKVLDCKR